MAWEHHKSRAAEGIVRGVPRLLLRTEAVALLAVCVILYAKFGSAWWLFLVLLLAPDVGMFGYVRGTRVGAATYNAFHTYVPPPTRSAAVLERPTASSSSMKMIAAPRRVPC